MRLIGVVLDWAGTLVDHGSLAPVQALHEVFAAAGVAIETGEARQSMGLAKKSHIAAILQLPRVRTAWHIQHGSFPDTGDVDKLYADFVPRQSECLKHNATLIEGVPAAIEAMRKDRGLAIGTTTGYTRPMLDYLLERAREQGFVPDAAVCPADVPEGRPAPWMCHRNALLMNVYPLSAMVKIGDTPTDIAEGLNAGMWTIGITRTGNEVGLSAAQWRDTPAPQQAALLAAAGQTLLAAGAHYIAESVPDCLEILDEIQKHA